MTGFSRIPAAAGRATRTVARVVDVGRGSAVDEEAPRTVIAR